jgi:hypothetical protein
MLDVAGILGGPEERRFNNVYFFDRNQDLIRETQKRIPGAIGFTGDFVETVLLNDPDDAVRIAERLPHIDQDNSLQPPKDSTDEAAIRKEQLRLNMHRYLLKSFPFDVINLDLEEYLFKPTERLPGRVVNALRKVFEWQRREFHAQSKKSPQTLDGFSLMFTTRIGPRGLGKEYLSMLRSYLEDNILKDPSLSDSLRKRTGFASVSDLEREDFEAFFKLAVPKALAGTLMEEDWYIDPQSGLLVYEFARTPAGVEPYRMLHLVMDVNRHKPRKEQRAPYVVSRDAVSAYSKTVKQIFESAQTILTEGTLDRTKLQTNLDHIIARRKKYCPEDT